MESLPALPPLLPSPDVDINEVNTTLCNIENVHAMLILYSILPQIVL